MTLRELVNVLDRDRSGLEIQVCKKEWDDYDIITADGELFKTIENKLIIDAEVIKENTIRVDLNWS